MVFFRQLRFMIFIFVMATFLIAAAILPIRHQHPDAYWLIYAADRLYQVTTNGEYRQALTPPEQYGFGDINASPNGESLAYVAHDMPGFRAAFGGCEPSIFYYQHKSGIQEILRQERYCATDTAFSEINFLSFSPDGAWLVYVHRPSYNTFMIEVVVPPRQMHRIRLDGIGYQALTNETGDQIQPMWSPDGEWIAYISQSAVGSKVGYLMRMRPYGSQQQRLVPVEGRYEDPVWSPDGKWLYFRTDDDGRFWNIFRLNMGNGDIEPVTNMSNNPRQYSFSPTGEQIAFIAGRNENADVFVMRSDGSDIRRLTNNDTEELSPVWSPDGEWIAFTTTTVSSHPIRSLVSIIRPNVTGERRIATSGNSPAWLRMPSLRWDRNVFPILGIDLLAATIVLTWLIRATLPSPLRIG